MQLSVSRTIDAPAGRIFALLADPNQYRMPNRVIAFEPDRRIGWRPEMDRAPGSALHMAGKGPRGQTYIYELAPDGPDRTVVTQVYDWSAVTAPDVLVRMPRVSQDELRGTPDRIAKAVE